MQYKELKVGDILQEGDEFFDKGKNVWRKTGFAGSEIYPQDLQPFRRPIQPTFHEWQSDEMDESKFNHTENSI